MFNWHLFFSLLFDYRFHSKAHRLQVLKHPYHSPLEMCTTEKVGLAAKKNGFLRYVINHEMEKKWSLFLEISFQYLVQDFGIKKSKFTVADSSVVIELDV